MVTPARGETQMKLAPKTQALDLAIQIAQLFHHEGYRWIEADNQLKPNWQTKTDHPLSVGEVVLTYLDPQKLIGVGFGQTTKYLLIDIDTLSKYHPEFDTDQYQNILKALESIGLVRYICLRSSHSDGRHLIFPLPESVNTFQLAAAARVTLTNAGFDLQNGQLEIFPNTKRFASKPGEYSHHKLHRLPLQLNSGSWLIEDDGLNPQPIPDSTEAQLTAFLNQWEMASLGQDMALLNRKLPQLYEQFKKRKRKYQAGTDEEKSAKAKKWEADLDLNIAIGWTDFGQTYQLLPKFLAKGVVFLKLEGQALKDWMLAAIYAAPGYEQFCRHKHEMPKLVSSWADDNERAGYYSQYRSNPNRDQSFMGRKQKSTKRQPHPANIRRSEDAKHRIKSAYEGVKELINATTTITELREMIRSKAQQMFGLTCSNASLTKHKSIWHPKYNNVDLTTPNIIDDSSPNLLLGEIVSPDIDTLVNTDLSAQSIAPNQFALTQIPMICSGSGIEEKTYTPPYPREIDYKQKFSTPQTTGKFQVLAEALSKIAALAALVVSVVSAVGMEPEPSVAAEIAPIEAKQTTTIEAYSGDLPPSQNPRIPSINLYPYNPNQNGVPWKSKEERDKFAGYLVIVAKADKSIANPYAWATKTLKNLKECGINSHWLNFTGQEMLDPDSPEARWLRQFFPAAAPPPANVTIHRSAEPTSAVIGHVTNPSDQFDQPTKTDLRPIDDPKVQTPVTPSRPPASSMESIRDIANRVNHSTPSDSETEHQHRPKDDNCPECQILTPAFELERWQMCRFCAQKILWRRLI
jgi:hypothetical protein